MLIPQNLGCLKQFSDEESTRYGLGGVKLSVVNGEDYELMATDTRMAIIVDGSLRNPKDSGTEFSKVGADDGTLKEGIIPAKAWDEAFRIARENRSIDKAVAVSLGDKAAILTADAGWCRATFTGEYLEGNFPDVRGAIPKSPAKHTMFVDPRRLLTILRVICDLCGELPEVEIEFRDESLPGTEAAIVFLSKNIDLEQRITMLLMPLQRT